jgi:glucose-1-phosphate adenylyltransferase
VDARARRGARGGILGLLAANRTGSPLRALGAPDALALAPFAGHYRLMDFALATLVNSGIPDLHVCTTMEGRAHGSYIAPGSTSSRITIVPVVPRSRRGPRNDRAQSLLGSLATLGKRPDRATFAHVACLAVDHVLLADLRPMIAQHEALGADVTLGVVTLAGPCVRGQTIVHADASGRVLDAEEVADDGGHPVLACTGDFLVRRQALPALLAGIRLHDQPVRAARLLERLVVHAYALDAMGPSSRVEPGCRPYWHDPVGLDAYYLAHMTLCTAASPLELYDASWPVPHRGPGGAPARVMVDRSGRKGVAFDSLVCHGATIDGGMVLKSVVGPGAVVEGGAEVEDCVLLQGCRIGRGARARRALIGVGAVVADDAVVGFDERPDASWITLPSGLTLVPPHRPAIAVAS